MADWSARFYALLEARTGIRLSQTILQRVSGVLRARADTLGYGDVDGYLAHLDRREASAELQRLVNLITVGKTSFNRYPDQIRAITETVVPALHELVPANRPICLWSVACSTGEEPYTIAMALAHAGWFDKRRFRILATDLNTNSLEHARVGRYFTLRTQKPPEFVSRYLDREGSAWRVRREIRDRVQFEHLNLADEAPFPDAGAWHVIVCANVLIYFGAHTVRRVLDRFVQAMEPDALLMVGGAESLTSFNSSLALAKLGSTYAYVRGKWQGRLDELFVGARAAAPAPAPPANAAPKLVAPIAERAKISAATPPPAPTEARPAGDRIGAEVDRLIALAERGEREQAIEGLLSLQRDNPEHPRPARTLGLLFFNERRFGEACDALGDAIAADPLAFDVYFYLGWIHLALGDIDQAREALRRALFLEPGFTFARYEFALTLHKAGDFEQAEREYARAEQAASDPRVKQRLREQAAGSGETFWIHDTFIVELCRNNRERAKRREGPMTSSRFPTVAR